eukprot:96822_1
MSSQVPFSGQVDDWTVIDVYTWIAQNTDNFGLNQDDLDSIEEAPLTGNQIIQKDDEQLSQEWAVSIHAARKIVAKLSQIQNKFAKRQSEPIITIFNGGNNANNVTSPHVHYQSSPTKNNKVSIDPNLANIPEEVASVPPNYYTPKITPRYAPSLQYNDSNITQIKLTLTITNDTYMGRLSHPKWWMDGHFNHIPNKIQSKDTINIDITGDVDTPLVGLLSFTLTLDPRYTTHALPNQHPNYAYSPYSSGAMANIPSWMIGPGGVPYIPPSVMRMYELQHECMRKMMQTAKQKQQKAAERQRRLRIKEERKRMKQKQKEERLAIKLEKRKLKRIQKEKEQREKEAQQIDENKESTTTATNEEKTKDDIVLRLNTSGSNKTSASDDTDSVVEKTSDSDEDTSDDSGDSSTESSEDEEEDNDMDIAEPPKYRLIILWSITPQQAKNGKTDRRDDIAQNSMAFMSVASSDLLHTMNRFNVLLLEDDTDPTAPDEFNLDNSYFNELEQAALIADIEQCLVEHEHFEIAATFGASPCTNEYAFKIDIDDSLGDWPVPLQQIYSTNPFALGFMPTQPHTLQAPYAAYGRQQVSNSMGYPSDITMIPPRIKQPTSVSTGALLSAKQGHRRRSSSHPVAPPDGMGNLVTLNEVLTESRSPAVDTLSPAVLFPKTAPRRKISTKAPRLSFWKEQMDNLMTQYHHDEHKGNSTLHTPTQSKGPSLYVPRHSHTRNGSPSSNRESSPSRSPQMPPQQPHLEHALSQGSQPTHSAPFVQYEIGDSVFVDDSKLGQIKSIGQHPAWGRGTWYGIRLTESIGNCDGEYKGQRTFSCPPSCGYFVQRNQLTQKLKTTRFDYMNEDYIDDKKKEFEKLKAVKDKAHAKSSAAVLSHPDETEPHPYQSRTAHTKESFAREIKAQQQSTNYDGSDEDPGDSDVPKPAGKYVPKQEKSHKKERQKSEEEKPRRKSKVNTQWTGGGPRTVVVRNKIPPIKEHAGYLHCKEGVQFQREMEWKKAIEKFKLGIALLEVTLMEIDRSMVKRKWKAQIEEFRHKMSRCTFEIQNNKRNRFIKKRDKIKKEQADKQAQAALARQADKMNEAQSKVLKREDHWKVTREDMEKKVQENEIDPNYDPSTGIRKSDAVSDSDNSDEVNSGRVGGDKTLAKAKKKHRKKKKKGKDKEDWSNFPGYENSNNKKAADSGSDSDDDDDKKKKDSKLSKHDQELRSRIEGDVMTKNPDLSFADVIGLNNVKLALYETIILPYIRPDLFESVSKSTQGLLLFGPPGNGKTMIAKCVASQCDATFFSISASSITSKFVGEAERIMRTLFNMARQRAPSIIFIDEIDSLLRTRGAANEAESSRRVKTEFLIQFDGVKTAEASDKNITIIGATNLPDQLDDAVLRRFPKRIMVPNPDAEARYSLIRLLTSKHRHDMSEEGFRQLADETDHYSCSDLAMLCRDAVMGPIRSMKGAVLLKAKKSDIPKIALKHFEDSIKNVRASCAPEAIQHYFKWDEQFGSKLFLTMDVLPENMKQAPLPSVEDEKRKKQEAEDAAGRAQMMKEEAKRQEEEAKREAARMAHEEEERRAQKENEKQSKLLKINSSGSGKTRRKSDNMFKTRKRNSRSSSYDDDNPQSKSAKKRSSGSFGNKPRVLNTKTFKISTDWNPSSTTKKGSIEAENTRRKRGHVSSPSMPDVLEKKKLWNSGKRSSKIGSNKKKKGQK